MQLLRLGLVLLVLLTASVLRAADDHARRPYLALGDNVSFGFITQAGFEYLSPANFIGFPNYVGEALKLATVNAACPGETTGSFLCSTAPDPAVGFSEQPPRSTFLMLRHTWNSPSHLKSHRETRLDAI